ncbi:diiron oxygenase [Kitasatospora sp. NPDC049285]|uniref:diiron oxygenase n=1 Tax=Kitasatospora sp. NPDC049285 TaxID=3157096 RepID=UPI0034451406
MRSRREEGSHRGRAQAEFLRERAGHRAAAEYDSRFRNWDLRAAVRRKPNRADGLEDAEAFLPFPPELAPAADHPLVRSRGPEAVRRVLQHSLYQYLHFTTELELLAVIPVVAQISRNRSGLALPAAMRSDAFKILTDEAWHAQFSENMLERLEQTSGVPRRLPGVPGFVAGLDELRERLQPELRGVEALLFSIVSETLISSVLGGLPHDVRLPPAVRELVRDHAEDEGRHHSYFHQVLRALWPALTPRERRAVGPLLPGAVLAFLAPDLRAIGLALRDVGLTGEEIAQVLVEAVPHDRVVADAAEAARSAIRYFAEAGALDDPATREAFEASGLLGPAAGPTATLV